MAFGNAVYLAIDGYLAYHNLASVGADICWQCAELWVQQLRGHIALKYPFTLRSALAFVTSEYSRQKGCSRP
jgi:hypothetical protein